MNKKAIIIQDEFIKFLKKHRSYSCFVKNLLNDDVYNNINNYLNTNTKFIDLITGAFIWNSKEFQKWNRLNMLWQKKLNNL